ncbi:MAG TPA: transcription elongation factor GreA [Ruminococcaceae bacterium]|jgi:transcription elongation factor GreA|nr:transcription elongation factor GreA [Oscillospiraceae bacterium]HBV44508.1 transcription elongation factor GreA [Oscillospiraceae bacterium]HBW73514.1 transcription elongation factor GreA [Oscillospiraceae bacterium]
MEKQIVLTRESYDAKVKELEQLKTTGRDEIAERIKVARSFGDLSENSEYDEAMNEQAKLEAKIARLENDIRNANILDEDNLNAGVVHPGSKVKVENVETGKKSEYTILGSSESNPSQGIISDQSPIGKSLIGNRKGDVVDVSLPTGKILQLKILSIAKSK